MWWKIHLPKDDMAKSVGFRIKTPSAELQRDGGADRGR